jgi:hypothetical protein
MAMSERKRESGTPRHSFDQPVDLSLQNRLPEKQHLCPQAASDLVIGRSPVQ